MFAKNIFRTALVCFATAALAILLSGVNVSALTTEVTPTNIPINLMYHGAKLSIKGQSGANDDLIVRLSSDPTDAHMKFKGKAAGIFWMKLGDISFENVPAVYLLYSSRNIDTLLSDEERVKEGIGFEAIKTQATVESSAENMDPDRWIMEFVKFKKAEKLYNVEEGTITRNSGSSSNDYQLEVNWPYQAAPGTYNVEVLAVRDGHVVDRAETSLTVARSGIVAQLSNLAFNNAALYGIIAIVVAMVAGFAVGALFKKGGGAH